MGPCLDGASLLHLDTAFEIQRLSGANLGTLYSRTWEGHSGPPPPIKSYSWGHCLSERMLPGQGHRGSQGVGPLDYPLASPLGQGLIYHLTFIPSSPSLAHICLHAYLILPSKYLLKSYCVPWHSSTRQD